MFDGLPKQIILYTTPAGDTPFARWRGELPYDAFRRINTRLTRLQEGNPGKPEEGWKAIGEGVYELKISFGVGYRVYFAFSGQQIILLLGGGTKPTQQADIKQAKQNWAEWQARSRS